MQFEVVNSKRYLRPTMLLTAIVILRLYMFAFLFVCVGLRSYGRALLLGKEGLLHENANYHS